MSAPDETPADKKQSSGRAANGTRRQYTVRTPAKVDAFCDALSESCNVGKACAAAGISRNVAYSWRKEDEDFARAWDEALKVGLSALEDEAHRRGFDGVDKPVFQQGIQVGSIREYSDTLAIFLLKAHNPARYRDQAQQSSPELQAIAAAVMKQLGGALQG